MILVNDIDNKWTSLMIDPYRGPVLGPDPYF